MNIQRNLILYTILFCFLGSCYGFYEVLAGVGAYIYMKSVCYSGRCCTKNEIPANFVALDELLRNELYGQPLVRNTVVKALRSHWNTDHKPDKALTLSFHGGPGIGKNYVSRMIQETMFSKDSSHVHFFVARLHFPEADKVPLYQRNLADWIIGNVTICPKQLFIFDEVNNMPRGVLDVLRPFIDYIDAVKGVNFKESIFMFLSNTGAQAVNEKTLDLWSKGIKREKMKLNDFERVISQGAFNEEGGFMYSETIKSNLIDHYIPFLPLMEEHVRSCIKKEFEKRGVYQANENDIKDVLEFIDWGPEPDRIFSKTGCKRISQKVALAV